MWPEEWFPLEFDYNRVKADLEAPNSLLDSRKLYAGTDGLPALKDSWVVFLDILGTTESMPALDDQTLRERLLLLDRLRWFIVDDKAATYQQALSFSDNLAVGEPLRSGDELLQLGIMLESVASYQLNLANRGVFLRGGVAQGPLYMDGRVVIGQGLIDAYFVESQEADVPRVVVEASVADAIRVDQRERWPRWSWDDVLLQDLDGKLFVSYIPVIGHDGLPGEIERGLAAHKWAVEAALVRHATDEKVVRKYQWVASYHNYVCATSFPEHVGYFIDTDASTAGRFMSPFGSTDGD